MALFCDKFILIDFFDLFRFAEIRRRIETGVNSFACFGLKIIIKLVGKYYALLVFKLYVPRGLGILVSCISF